MTVHALELDPDPAAAARALREGAAGRLVLVYKHSPICPVSHRAKEEVERFLASLDAKVDLHLARVDVIAERALARGLTAELGLRHESPQALWFERGELVWHGSHGEITRAHLDALVRRSQTA